LIADHCRLSLLQPPPATQCHNFTTLPHSGIKMTVMADKKAHLHHLLADRDLSWMKEERAAEDRMNPKSVAKGWVKAKLLPAGP
jgi:hypothetical protein